MKKFLTVLCLCVVSNIAFGEPTYNCRYQDKRETGFLGLNERDWWGSDPTGYLYCGHVGTDGCKDGDVILMNHSLKRCQDHSWTTIDYNYVEDCEKNINPYYYYYYVAGSWFVLYNKGKDTEALAYYCKLPISDIRTRCTDSGGEWNSTKCNCPSETMEKEFEDALYPCKCKYGFEYGDDKKCWPKGWRLKCYSVSDTIYCPDVSGWFNGREFVKLPLKHCAFFYSGNNYFRACNIDNDIKHRDGVACDGVSDKVAYDAWNSDNHVIGTDADGLQCLQPATKYNYQTCTTDNDCKNIDNTKRPYLHSTAWHCAWQSAGVRVCTATACESGWTPINGYCQEDKNTQTPQSENKNANSVSNIKTETKAGTKKPCTDLDNMDSNCNCVVPGTVVRGGKCVCSDDNQEIKNGRCEWTAKYVAGLESDLDSKFNGLTATIGGFEKNVWRDENGEFNTARLASDSIAGIVLGTVGGIVTANLVKKAQVKQGFEDIGCYIGGQSVAGFGDEFNVGR